ncbi:DUF5412 family protein [Lysinibacillus xylanilyticus]|uniref:DUF5412 family protein n=1 Tax=Lysinibacillus xylanilyticus TaxID=582475 RepID=UPI0038109585
MNNAEKLEIKKVYKKTLLVLLISILFFAGIIGYGIYWLFFDWTRFKQELIAESTSPQGTYTVKAYVSDAGATTSFSVLGELVFNFFQRVFKHPLKEVEASGGCHGIGKEFFVQAQSRFRTQLCRGIIDS